MYAGLLAPQLAEYVCWIWGATTMGSDCRLRLARCRLRTCGPNFPPPHQHKWRSPKWSGLNLRYILLPVLLSGLCVVIYSRSYGMLCTTSTYYWSSGLVKRQTNSVPLLMYQYSAVPVVPIGPHGYFSPKKNSNTNGSLLLFTIWPVYCAYIYNM